MPRAISLGAMIGCIAAATMVQAQEVQQPDNMITVPTIAAPAITPPPAVKRICKTDFEIGSMVKRIRRCGSAADWAKAKYAAHEDTRMIQDVKDLGIGR